ncbi:LamG-like jellyroll fold domain-containing protein [Actinocrispum sp. NPDC049592]|uniref:LamG-like jellyroll fold domain-containing protein n=1 Tax=Actinocrispum sp. NPDC049592 TaxID=3154835 RepID=UPI0034196275
MMRALISAAVAVAATVVFLPAPATARPEAPPPPAAAPQDELAVAARTGKPVEVQSKTTETSQVFANPDGTFTMRSNPRPTRAKRGDGWHDIDTTLKVRPDGTIAPVMSTTDVAFANGGTAPVITAAEGDKKLALSWPTALPKPVLDKNTATYKGVLPGVDLQVAATTSGFSEVLIVHDAQAAKNPALADFGFTATTTGLTLQAGPDGALDAKDSAGATVFHGATPLMWDQKKTTAMKLGTQPRMAARSANGTATDIRIRPDLAALTGPDVQYPVYIDPIMSRTKDAWLEVTSNGWHYWNDDSKEAQVGDCDGWSGCGSSAWTARSYFQMPASDLAPRNGKKPVIYSGHFYALQVHAAHACTPEDTDLKLAGYINADTRWPATDWDFLGRISSAAGDNCGGPGTLDYDVKGIVQREVDENWGSITFLLRAAGEDNRFQWKRFDNNPTLEVVFSFPPNGPTDNQIVNSVNCGGKVVTPTATPTLSSTATDNNNPPLGLGMWFEAWDAAQKTRYAKTTSAVIFASGARANWPVPSALADGDYTFRTSVENSFPGDSSKNLWAGVYSPWLNFTVRAKPIPGVPVVLPSADYPPNSWGAQAGAPGVINVEHLDGGPGLVGFSYSFDGAGSQHAPATTDCDYTKTFGLSGGWVPATSTNRATIQIPAGLTPGYHTLYVKSFDDAHKMSVESAPYIFYVSPNTGGTTTRIEAESLTITQPAGQNVPAEKQTGPVWSGGGQQFLRPTAVGQSFGMPFTVSADADYRIGLGITHAVDYGQNTYTIDGQPIGRQTETATVGPFDNYDTFVGADYYSLGTRRLTAGTHTLGVQITGTNAASIGGRYYQGLDYLTLTTTGRFEAEQPSQVTAAQPAGQDATLGVVANPAWSDAAELSFQPKAANTSFDLSFQVPIEADYSLAVGMTQQDHAGRLQISVDGKALARSNEEPWDGYASALTPTHVRLGGQHLAAGTHKLTFRVVGKNDAAAGFEAGVDYLVAIPINNITVTDFASALNNDGIAPDTAPGHLDLSQGGLSAQTMAAVGLVPGATKVINGAAFTMPQPKATGEDDVVAYGQTIPVAQVKASAFGLLATGTCGGLPATTATITYTDGTTQNPYVPEVQDWAMGQTDSAAFVLPYRTLVNSGVDRTVKPRLYTIFLPTDPSKTLKSVTLPSYGTPGTADCQKPALNIFSMAPRPVATGWLGAWSAPSDGQVVPPVALNGQTVRTVVKPSMTGASVRVKLSNPQGSSAMTVGAASVGAQSAGASLASAPVPLTFGGSASVTIPAGGDVVSDAATFPAGGTGNLVVSLNFTSVVDRVPVHAFTTSYLASGNQTAATDGAVFGSTLPGSYYLAGVDVSTTDSSQGTVVVLGDQFSAGTGADKQTWVDKLPGALGALGQSVPGSLVNASRSGVPATGLWKLNDGSGSTAANSVAGGVPVTLSGTTWSSDHGGSAVFDGSASYGATSGPVLSTTKSYTVAAWAKLTSTAGNYTIVSQSGTNQSAFFLQYKLGTGWAFVSPSEDTAAPGAYAMVAGPAPTLNTWTHLAGVYDATTEQMSLYINGKLVGSVRNPSAFDTAGPMGVGGVKVIGGAVRNQFNGSISDVRVFRFAANAEDIALMYKGDAVTTPGFGSGAPTTLLGARTVDRTVTGQPNLRTAIVALGADDVLSGKSKDEILQGIRTLAHPAGATGLRNYRRADGTVIHVILSTIPALGLGSGDAREAVRKQVNDFLKSGYVDLGADGVLDVAGTVADPAAPSNVAPALLTGGVPNSAFYDKIAQMVAKAVTDFPPLEL